MLWEKLGRIFHADGQRAWMTSHTSLPFGLPIDDRRLRIFFSPRDRLNRSHIAWLEIDVNAPSDILALSDEPFLAPGPRGQFDDCGVMPSWITPLADGFELYFIGWNVRTTVPFHHGLGRARMAESRSVAPLQRPAGPFMDRDEADPYYVTNPCVLRDGDAWQMWYLSGVGWSPGETGLQSRYLVKSARSSDGRRWSRDGAVAVGFASEDETAIARPSVIRDPEGYRMWFSFRGTRQSYRIGTAVSDDGIAWSRDPQEAGPRPSETGWDSEMIAYPHVFDMAGERFMLYCGNGYGRSGFGIARQVR